jgi:hypothetical protein
MIKCKNNWSYMIYNSIRLEKAILNGSVFMEKSDLSTRDQKSIYRYCIYKNDHVYPSFYRVDGSQIFYKKLIQAINHK